MSSWSRSVSGGMPSFLPLPRAALGPISCRRLSTGSLTPRRRGHIPARLDVLSDLLAWYEDAEHKRDIWVQAYAKKQLQRHMRQAGLDLLESERSKDVRKLKGWMDSEDGRAATTEKRPVSAARRKAAAQIAAQNGA